MKKNEKNVEIHIKLLNLCIKEDNLDLVQKQANKIYLLENKPLMLLASIFIQQIDKNKNPSLLAIFLDKVGKEYEVEKGAKGCKEWEIVQQIVRLNVKLLLRQGKFNEALQKVIQEFPEAY